MKRIVLLEIDVPEDDPKEYIKERLGQNVTVRVLRFKDMEDYDNSFDDYWRFD